ncbi:hypothetical protein EJ08DRAFT_645986 [Tothia fuscella]|uniref:CFEM domain-containing protein n=1 Tax=Tothia fuscella TaxID=1048955 RepID=A0A9P4P0K6_9PEZI|nr:hypothetical protein EJ08DRAFT_645986 [Tothia fuscella]
MRVTSVSVIVALAATGLAQSATDLPKCATSCVGNSLQSGTGCSTIDIGCICKSSGWIAGLACCVSKSCPKPDQDATIKYAQNLCAAYAKLPTEASCPSNSTTSAAPSSGSSGASTSVGPTSVGPTSSAASGVASGTNAAASAAKPSSSAAAAGQFGVGAGIAALGFLAAAL